MNLCESENEGCLKHHDCNPVHTLNTCFGMIEGNFNIMF